MPLLNSPDQGATPISPATAASPTEKSVQTKVVVIPENNTDAEQYRKSVDNLMSNNSPLALSNSQPAHAAILFEKFFEYAKRHVRIFSWKLISEVFGDAALCRQAEAALLRGVRITVIVQEAPEPSAFLDLLGRHPECVTILSTQRTAMPFARTASDWLLNFAVMDERAYRVEQNRNDGKAQAVMNGPDYANTLVTFFAQVAQRLQALTPMEVKA